MRKHSGQTVRLIAIGCIPPVVAAGLGCKYYRGPGADWVNNWGPASVAYELLFMLLAFAIVPNRSAITRIAVIVFVGTCLVEFSQLWNPGWLADVRQTLPGRLALGSSFSWWDFPAYLIGCLLGVPLLHGICRVSARQHDEANANYGDE